jgi:hypothetical protein
VEQLGAWSRPESVQARTEWALEAVRPQQWTHGWRRCRRSDHQPLGFRRCPRLARLPFFDRPGRFPFHQVGQPPGPRHLCPREQVFHPSGFRSSTMPCSYPDDASMTYLVGLGSWGLSTDPTPVCPVLGLGEAPQRAAAAGLPRTRLTDKGVQARSYGGWSPNGISGLTDPRSI